MDLTSRFECWRQLRSTQNSWGLAWFLASELCQRFHASHGLAPWVIAHDGLGYYGIGINRLPCAIHPTESEPLGRFTSGGDVENWRSGSPGDHGAKLMRQCADGMATSELVAAAIRHLDLPPYPAKSHVSCRHHRWGASYVLCFQLAACLALRYNFDEIEIWNHPLHTRPLLLEHDPKWSMHEHPGLFVFSANGKTVCIAGDGRVLDESEANVWERYMAGDSAAVLAKWLAQRLAL